MLYFSQDKSLSTSFSTLHARTLSFLELCDPDTRDPVLVFLRTGPPTRSSDHTAEEEATDDGTIEGKAKCMALYHRGLASLSIPHHALHVRWEPRIGPHSVDSSSYCEFRGKPSTDSGLKPSSRSGAR